MYICLSYIYNIMANNTKEIKPNNSSNLSWWEYLIPGYNTYRIVEYLTDKYGKSAKMAIDDVIDNKIRRPIRTKLGISNRRTLTERNFDNRFLKELSNITDSIAHSRIPNLDERLEKGDTINLQIHGNDYVPNYGGTKVNRSIKDRVTTPRGQIETSLGSYGAQYTKDNIIINDMYDWDSKTHLDEANNYGMLRNFMGLYGTPDTIPDNDKTQVKIKYNRKPKKK